MQADPCRGDVLRKVRASSENISKPNANAMPDLHEAARDSFKALPAFPLRRFFAVGHDSRMLSERHNRGRDDVGQSPHSGNTNRLSSLADSRNPQ